MLCRLFIVALAVFTLSSPAHARLVRVEFTAELDRENSAGTAVESLEGYFVFDDSQVENYPISSIFLDSYAFTTLVELGIGSSAGFVIGNEGIVVRVGGLTDRTIQNDQSLINNSIVSSNLDAYAYATVYAISVGSITSYPESYSEPELAPSHSPGTFCVWADGSCIGTGVDYEDLHTFNVIEIPPDFPDVDKPLLQMFFSVPYDTRLTDSRMLDPTVLGDLNPFPDFFDVPPELTIFQRESGWGTQGSELFGLEGVSATYRITSLTVVPEPSGLVLVCSATFSLVSRRRRFTP